MKYAQFQSIMPIVLNIDMSSNIDDYGEAVSGPEQQGIRVRLRWLGWKTLYIRDL